MNINKLSGGFSFNQRDVHTIDDKAIAEDIFTVLNELKRHSDKPTRNKLDSDEFKVFQGVNNLHSKVFLTANT